MNQFEERLRALALSAFEKHKAKYKNSAVSQYPFMHLQGSERREGMKNLLDFVVFLGAFAPGYCLLL